MGIKPKVKAVFLDRDGVLNKSVILNRKPYPPKHLHEIELVDGVREGLILLKQNGFLLIVVTNQPDVSRGTTKIEIVNTINNYIQQSLGLDEIFCCPHDNSDNCSCRKPKPGMILEASAKWNIDLKKSFLIGDRWRDIEAGKNAGLKTILLDYGYNEESCFPDYKCKSFHDAVQIIKSLS
jgi:D-glycero-D-manno-heptose 1,7-bisphosphate phosphatase